MTTEDIRFNKLIYLFVAPLNQWFPTRGEFLPREEFYEFRGGISTLRTGYLFIVKCCFFQIWHWLFQLVICLYICKLFSDLSHVFVDKLQRHYLTSNGVCLTFINLGIVVNKDDCSN